MVSSHRPTLAEAEVHWLNLLNRVYERDLLNHDPEVQPPPTTDLFEGRRSIADEITHLRARVAEHVAPWFDLAEHRARDSAGGDSCSR